MLAGRFFILPTQFLTKLRHEWKKKNLKKREKNCETE